MTLWWHFLLYKSQTHFSVVCPIFSLFFFLFLFFGYRPFSRWNFPMWAELWTDIPWRYIWFECAILHSRMEKRFFRSGQILQILKQPYQMQLYIFRSFGMINGHHVDYSALCTLNQISSRQISRTDYSLVWSECSIWSWLGFGLHSTSTVSLFQSKL